MCSTIVWLLQRDYRWFHLHPEQKVHWVIMPDPMVQLQVAVPELAQVLKAYPKT